MATTTRIYEVIPTAEGQPMQLVRAAHPSHAVSHVAAGAFTARVASQDALVDLLSRGVVVETIRVEQLSITTEEA